MHHSKIKIGIMLNMLIVNESGTKNLEL